MTADKYRAELRKMVSACGTQAALAKKIGVSRSFLNDVLLGKREPSGKVLSWLGFVRVVRYIRVKK